MSGDKLKYTQKMVGKRVAIIEKGNTIYGKVEAVRDFETVIVDLGTEKREVSIYEIRAAE